MTQPERIEEIMDEERMDPQTQAVVERMRAHLNEGAGQVSGAPPAPIVATVQPTGAAPDRRVAPTQNRRPTSSPTNGAPSGDLINDLAGLVRRNPLPALALTLGVGYLIARGRGR